MITAATKAKRAAIYCRVSTDEQAENGFSLADQERKGRRQAEAKDWLIGNNGEAYIDNGVSGTARHRPALDRLLQDIKDSKIDVFVCTKMDRLARNLKLLLELWDTIESCGCIITIIDENIDTSTSFGRLSRNFMGSFAEFERDTIVARTKAGKEARARSGRMWRGATNAPYGFRCITDANIPAYEESVRRGEKPPHENGWVVVPDEAVVVKRIFTSLASGVSMHTLARELVRDGIPSPRGNRAWTVPTIHGILRNPAAWGNAAYGRTKTVRRPGAEDGAVMTVRQDPAQVIYGHNPAIVSEELAEVAQRTVSGNRSLSKRNSKQRYLLAGSKENPLLVCGVCAAEGKERMMGGRFTAGKKPTHGGYRFYRCANFNDDGKREQHTVPADRLEEAVWEVLRNIVEDPDRALAEVQAIADSNSAQAAALTTLIAGLEAQVASIQRKRDALIEFVGDWSRERVLRLDQDLELQAQPLLDQLDVLRAQLTNARANSLPVDNVRAACARIARGMEKATFEERQWIVRTLVHRVIATPEKYIVEGVLPMLNHVSNEADDPSSAILSMAS